MTDTKTVEPFVVGGRKLDISLHQMFDLICDDLSEEDYCRDAIGKIIGDYTDAEIYAYLNKRAETGVLSMDEATTILMKLDSFRSDYIRG